MRYRHLKLQGQDEGKNGLERIKTHWMEIHVFIGKADRHPPVVKEGKDLKIW